jgi:hypothetical protein
VHRSQAGRLDIGFRSHTAEVQTSSYPVGNENAYRAVNLTTYFGIMPQLRMFEAIIPISLTSSYYHSFLLVKKVDIRFAIGLKIKVILKTSTKKLSLYRPKQAHGDPVG